ncbi:hypothetical protein [Actinomyces glycerinitolerans]|uniref:Transmembrane protein n=1 Tax=Actinomyces glycerinitolerans TaxID=1892869 RepID=A0A1M4RXC6_9ACTO|nr:hypothetical protein [Actinomyces glycerinitolerans]SHE24644.1 Hypothetical protein ACGLYG10_0852 [Actinomyces glycerinitolerans]
MRVIQLRVKDLWWCSGLLPLWTVIGSVIDGAVGWELFFIPYALLIQLFLQLLLASVAAAPNSNAWRELPPWTNRTALVVLALALLWPPLVPALTDWPEFDGILTRAGMSSDAAGAIGYGLVLAYLLAWVVALIVAAVEGAALTRRAALQQPIPPTSSPGPAHLTRRGRWM